MSSELQREQPTALLPAHAYPLPAGSSSHPAAAGSSPEQSQAAPAAPCLVTRVTQLHLHGEPSEWVFASKTASDGRISEPRHAHNRALAPTGLRHISLHGLRRSFGTLSEWVEVPVGVVAQIQGHKPSAIAEKHYRRRPLDLLRMWHDKIEAWILEQAKMLMFTQN